MAAINYAFTAQNSPQTTTSATFGAISGAALASGSFTAGKQYLLFVTVQGTVATNVGYRFRVVHGSTQFAESEGQYILGGASRTSCYSWFTVWTAVASEAITIEFRNVGGVTAITADQIGMVAINLSDDLTENTDWFFAERATDDALSTSPVNGAAITFTPGTASHDWLTLTYMQGNIAAITNILTSAVTRSGEASSALPSNIRHISSLVNAPIPNEVMARVFTLGAASNTFTEISTANASGPTRLHSAVFAINLNKFADHSYAYTEASATYGTTSYATVLQTGSITPADSGDVWVGSYFAHKNLNVNRTTHWRLQIDGTDAPTGQTTDARIFGDAANTDQKTPQILTTLVTSMTAASHAIDIDGDVDSAAQSTAYMERTLWAVTLELAAAGTTAIEVTPPADSLNNWADNLGHSKGYNLIGDSMTMADQPPTIALTGLQPLTVAPAADSLGLYADQAPTILFTGALKLTPGADSLGLYLDQTPTVFRQGILSAAPAADSFAAYTDSSNQFLRFAAAQTDDLNQWADQRNISTGAGALTIGPPADNLAGYADTATLLYTAAISVSISDSLGLYADQSPTILYTAARSAAPPADSLGLYADQTPTVFRQGILSAAPAADSLALYADASNQFLRFAAQLSDALANYVDQVLASTGAQKFATFTDPLSIHADSLNGRLHLAAGQLLYLVDGAGNFILDENGNRIVAGGLIDNLDQGDSVAVTRTIAVVTPITVSVSDALGSYSDALQIQQGGALFISLTDALGSYTDALNANSGLFAAPAGDALAAYTDTMAGVRGLLYSTPADGLANYLDLVTVAGSGQLQAALSDSLGQYNDAPARTFSNMRATPPADNLAVYADSIAPVIALRYALADSALALADLLDVRVGLFNELRFGLSDNLNQWADQAAYTRAFFAIRITGELTDRVSLTGKVIAEQISITGKAVHQADITGELYIGTGDS